MRVKLTLPEMLSAANIGTIRQYTSDQRKSEYSVGFTEEKMTALAAHIEGAMGEICVAKALGVYFDATVNTYGKADLGDDIGVRTTNKESNNLVLYPKDNPNYFYYLVKGSSPNYRICGWIQGKDAKQDKYLVTHINRSVPVWRIPEEDLNPISMTPPRRRPDDVTA